MNLLSSFRFLLRSFLASSLLLGLLNPAFAQVPVFDQAGECGVGLTPSSYAAASMVTADAQGNTYVVGQFNGSVRFGTTTLTGYYDAFVAKRDASGAWLWASGGGGAEYDRFADVAVDAQGQVYAVGEFAAGSRNVPVTATFGGFTITSAGYSDVLVAKLDGATGAWLWVQQAGFGNANTGTDLGRAVAPDGAGGVLVAGTFDGPALRVGATVLQNVGRGTDLFVARLDATTGVWGWAVSTGHGTVADLAADAQGNAYLTGTFGSGIAFSALFPLTQQRGSYLAKIDRLGAWQWAINCTATPGTGTFPGGIGLTYCGGLATDNAGHLYACGEFSGGTASFGATTLTNTSGTFQGGTAPGSIQNGDAFVTRLDAATGAWQWAVRAGGVDGEHLNRVAVRGNRVYVGGAFGRGSQFDPGTPSPTGSAFGATALVSAGQYDIVVAALDTAGVWQWALRAGGPTQDDVAGLTLDASNRLHFNGSISGANAQFGPFAVVSTAYLARLAGGTLAARSSAGQAPFALYPNPARSAVAVEGLPPGQAVEVLDAVGRRVAHGQIPARGPLPLPPGLPLGMYVVRSGAQAQRLLVE